MYTYDRPVILLDAAERRVVRSPSLEGPMSNTMNADYATPLPSAPPMLHSRLDTLRDEQGIYHASCSIVIFVTFALLLF